MTKRKARKKPRLPRPPLTVWQFAVRHKLMSTILALLAATGTAKLLESGNHVLIITGMMGKYDSWGTRVLCASIALLVLVIVFFVGSLRLARLLRVAAETRPMRPKPHMVVRRFAKGMAQFAATRTMRKPGRREREKGRAREERIPAPSHRVADALPALDDAGNGGHPSLRARSICANARACCAS